ncbi:MAG: thioester domain-containing protein [Bacteroidota bacterium]
MKMRIILLASIITVLTCCSKSGNEEPSGNTHSPGAITEPGYGNSNQPFKDAAWQLPAGVQLEDSIHEYSYCWAFAPYTQVPPKDWKGIPLGFSFCLTLKNTTNQPIIIQFPPSLVYTSSSLLYQNILTIELGTIEIPASSSKTIVTQGFCINLGRSIPQTYDEATGNYLSYSFGPSAVPAALQEIIDILKAKHISIKDVLAADGTVDNNKATKYFIIQTAIWEVTDKEGLTTDTKNQLLAL